MTSKAWNAPTLPVRAATAEVTSAPMLSARTMTIQSRWQPDLELAGAPEQHGGRHDHVDERERAADPDARLDIAGQRGQRDHRDGQEDVREAELDDLVQPEAVVRRQALAPAKRGDETGQPGEAGAQRGDREQERRVGGHGAQHARPMPEWECPAVGPGVVRPIARATLAADAGEAEIQAIDTIPAMAGVDVPYRVVRTEPARSAEESAEFQGIELGSLLRTIVVRRGEDDYVFVLVPAAGGSTGRSSGRTSA